MLSAFRRKGQMATLTWLGHSAFRLETDRGKHVYVDPFLTGNPIDAGGRADARARRRDRDHARPRRPRRRRRRALAALPRRRDRLPGRAEEVAAREGRERRRRPGPQQGRHAGHRRDRVHADRRAALVLRRRDGPVPRRVVRVRDHARGRRAGLLRRRHLHVRRHAADPPPLRAAARGAADRRPLHDGAARGRDRARHARPAALRAVPLGHVPAADRHAGRARRAGRRRRRRRDRSPATPSRSRPA